MLFFLVTSCSLKYVYIYLREVDMHLMMAVYGRNMK
jgi:hypothetical protein